MKQTTTITADRVDVTLKASKKQVRKARRESKDGVLRVWLDVEDIQNLDGKEFGIVVEIPVWV
jgi:hypothetical protein